MSRKLKKQLNSIPDDEILKYIVKDIRKQSIAEDPPVQATTANNTIPVQATSNNTTPVQQAVNNTTQIQQTVNNTSNSSNSKVSYIDFKKLLYDNKSKLIMIINII